MSSKVTEIIQKLIYKIESDDYTNSDVELLFVRLRTVTKNKYIVEIANFVTHAEGRNKGISHELTNNYFVKLADLAESSGGSLVAPSPIFRMSVIIHELMIVLSDLKVEYDQNRLKAQTDGIKSHLQDMMDEVPIVVKDVRIAKSWLKKSDGKVYVCYRFGDLKPGVMILSKEMTWQIEMFI